MKYIISFLLLSTLFTQNLTITGTVVDIYNTPIEGVNIYAGNIGTVSDADGLFTLNLYNKGFITFSHIGYEEIAINSSDVQGNVKLSFDAIKANEVIVRSGLAPQNLHNTTSSTTIFSKTALKKSTGSHFDYLTNKISNLMSVGGTSRARYFQIRGIGERSQYTGETPPNFSVGYIMDGIDFSGIGMMGFLFDTQQIEVFKGPQSSAYGPNALAGLINIKSVDPTPFLSGNLSSTIGSDNISTNSVAFGWPITPKILFRIAGQAHSQYGFRTNQFTLSDTTNQKYEMFYRGKLHYMLTPSMNIKLTHFFSGIDNSYDVWAVNNNQDYNTYSDKAGEDDQETTATSVIFNMDLLNTLGFKGYYQYVTADHHITYSYDGDWGNNQMWVDGFSYDPVDAGYDYDFFDKTYRIRQTDTHELRIHNDDSKKLSIIFGVYSAVTNEHDNAEGYLFGGDASHVDSRFNITNVAGYSEIRYKIRPNTTILVNLRSELQNMSYNGNSFSYGDTLPYVGLNTENTHFGGKIALIKNISSKVSRNVSLSRGFKAGGINQNPYLSESSRLFDPESNVNIEGGYTYSSDKTLFNINLFYMFRLDQQVQISSQQDPENPNSFYYFTSNAGGGYNAGSEISLRTKISSNLSLNSSLGLLTTHIDEYVFDNGEESIAMGNREQALSPLYNYSIGVSYTHESGIFSTFDYSGKSSYYYSDSHDQKTDGYGVCDLGLGYQKNGWSLTLWGKNVLDTRYPIRGFYFGIEPPNYEDKLYLHFADPMHFGATLSYQF